MTRNGHIGRGSFYSPGEISTQNLVLTVLGLHLNGSDSVWSGALVELFGDLGFSTKATRAALSRLVAAGMLERHRNGRCIDYSLTMRARSVLDEAGCRIAEFAHRPGRDDVWTILFHSIPVDRVVLRRLGSGLRSRGFVSPQDATWVAPGDHESYVHGLVDELGAGGHTMIFIARHCPGYRGALPSNIWDMDDLIDRYDDFLDRFTGLDISEVGSALTDREAFTLRVRVIRAFWSLLQLDPALPESSPALQRRRGRAVALFEGATKVLEEPAGRHFDKVASEGSTVCRGRDEIVAHPGRATHLHAAAGSTTARVG